MRATPSEDVNGHLVTIFCMELLLPGLNIGDLQSHTSPCVFPLVPVTSDHKLRGCEVCTAASVCFLQRRRGQVLRSLHVCLTGSRGPECRVCRGGARFTSLLVFLTCLFFPGPSRTRHAGRDAVQDDDKCVFGSWRLGNVVMLSCEGPAAL